MVWRGFVDDFDVVLAAFVDFCTWGMDGILPPNPYDDDRSPNAASQFLVEDD